MFVGYSLDYLLLQSLVLNVTVELLFVNSRVYVCRSDLYKITQIFMETNIKQCFREVGMAAKNHPNKGS